MYMNTAFDNVCFKGSIVSQSARFVYLCLCKHADNTKQTCFPSLSRIAQIVGKSISTIKRAIRELCKYGAIKRTPRYRKDGGQTSNLYEIMECDFEQLVEIPDNTEEKKAENIVDSIAEVELENQDTMTNTAAEDILFSVPDNQLKSSRSVKDNETRETTPYTEKETIQKDNTAEQQEETTIKNKEPENKSVHIKSENNSVNPINVMNENVDEAEQLYINEKTEQGEKQLKQEKIEFIVYPISQNNNQIVNEELDHKLTKTNLDSIKSLSIKKSFIKIIKPIYYMISAYKSCFITKLNRGEVTSDPPGTYPIN